VRAWNEMKRDFNRIDDDTKKETGGLGTKRILYRQKGGGEKEGLKQRSARKMKKKKRTPSDLKRGIEKRLLYQQRERNTGGR